VTVVVTDELRRLIEQLPEEELPWLVSEVRKRTELRTLPETVLPSSAAPSPPVPPLAAPPHTDSTRPLSRARCYWAALLRFLPLSDFNCRIQRQLWARAVHTASFATDTVRARLRTRLVRTRALETTRFLTLRVRQRSALVTLPPWGDLTHRIHQAWRTASCWPRSLNGPSGWKSRLPWDELKHRTARLWTRALDISRLLGSTLRAWPPRQKLPFDEPIHWPGDAWTRAQESTRSITGMVRERATLVTLLPWGDVTPRIQSATYWPRSLGRTVHQWTSRVAWNELRHRTHEAWAGAARTQHRLALTLREWARRVWFLAWHELTDRARQVSAGAERTKAWLSGTVRGWPRQWPWRYVGFVVAGLVLSASFGTLVTVALTWPSVARYGFGPGRIDNLPVTTPQIARVDAARSVSTASLSGTLATATPHTPTLAPALAAVVTGATPAPPAPTAMIAAATPPTPEPSPTAEPTAAEVWTTVSPALDAAWGTDTQTTITLLDNFLARFPEYALAREKLYAALLTRADELRDAGDIDAAADQAQRAASLMPDRPEARAMMVGLETPPASPSRSTDESTDSSSN
jgi:hypothetical protein